MLPAAAVAARIRKREYWVRFVVLTALAMLVIWSFRGMEFDFTHLKAGLRVGREDIVSMFPHSRTEYRSDIEYLSGLKDALRETLQIALVGTVLGALLALPVSFIAARTTSLFRPLSSLVKTILNAGRAVPILIYALLIVSIVGLGAPAGAVAIGLGTFVMLAKLYAEALESLSPGPVEAVKASGGNAPQIFVFGMLPQVFPNYLSATLYAFELNLQASFVLGIVGAGGIGFELQNDIRLFQMLQVGALIFVLIVLVNAVDYLSYRVRLLFT